MFTNIYFVHIIFLSYNKVTIFLMLLMLLLANQLILLASCMGFCLRVKERKIVVQLTLIRRKKVTMSPRISESYKIKWKMTTIKCIEIENYNMKNLRLDLPNKR